MNANGAISAGEIHADSKKLISVRPTRRRMAPKVMTGSRFWLR
jgi:hypothetical protein